MFDGRVSARPSSAPGGLRSVGAVSMKKIMGCAKLGSWVGDDVCALEFLHVPSMHFGRDGARPSTAS
jgi:hypothetical protein